MNLKHVKTLFFDYDGTIHDSLYIYKPAFLKAYEMLVEEGYRKSREWQDHEVMPFLGQSPKEMWDSFGPDLPERIKQRASDLIGNTMKILIEEQKAKLYPHAFETLSTLKSRGYTLVFISNCRTQYMKDHTVQFKLDTVFSSMVCAEMYDYLPKEVILKSIISNFEGDYAIIGDRHHDIKAGKFNEITTIGCRYGFGKSDELSDADFHIDKIIDLLELFL